MPKVEHPKETPRALNRSCQLPDGNVHGSLFKCFLALAPRLLPIILESIQERVCTWGTFLQVKPISSPTAAVMGFSLSPIRNCS